MYVGEPSQCRGREGTTRGDLAAHPCKRAYDALRKADHSPQVVKVFGLASLPDVTRGRKEVKRLTGESYVPVLVTDDGEVVSQSGNIIRWAEDHPAGAGQAAS